MSIYRTLTVEAQLTDNQINASADVNGNIATDAEFTNKISVNNVSDYELLNNLPQIEGVTLIGNKTHEELNLQRVSNAEIEELFINL